MSKRLHIRKPSVFLPELTDEQITEACRLLTAYEVATIPPEDSYTEPYSDAYIAYMHELMANYKAGAITPAKVPMGWQYYTRRGIAAVLIAALLAGIAMPEKVIAGYRWLVEVVEEFLEDRTRYRYTSNVDEDVEFVPMKFGYLPEGMEEVKNQVGNASINRLFVDNTTEEIYYLRIVQNLVENDNKYLYGANVEVYYTEIILINDEMIKIAIDDQIIYYSWVCDLYHISGQTNVSKNELTKILMNIDF
ncbi:MAG: hypothetical protein IJD56_07060 [Peptococcaceae bacterium]|nr:hypothetical protein [Peptococcaceae bacterium]